MTKFISINSHVIRKRGDRPVRIARSRSDKQPVYVNEVEIIGPAKPIYDPERRIMSCGARLVLECEEVRILR